MEPTQEVNRAEEHLHAVAHKAEEQARDEVKLENALELEARDEFKQINAEIKALKDSKKLLVEGGPEGYREKLIAGVLEREKVEYDEITHMAEQLTALRTSLDQKMQMFKQMYEELAAMPAMSQALAGSLALLEASLKEVSDERNKAENALVAEITRFREAESAFGTTFNLLRTVVETNSPGADHRSVSSQIDHLVKLKEEQKAAMKNFYLVCQRLEREGKDEARKEHKLASTSLN